MLPGLETKASRERCRIEQADAVEWLRATPPRSLDLIVTDPAYESLEKHRAKGTTTRLSHSNSSSNDWFEIFPNARFEDLWQAAYVALRDDAHFYVLCDQETGFYLHAMNARLGTFKFWKAIIWDKITIGMGYHYRARHEWVLFFEKGKRKLNDLGVPDVLTFPRVHNRYPTEKPAALLSVLIEQSTDAGDVVADPFVGSGSCAEAALTQGRCFRGCDSSASAVEIARARALRVINHTTEPEGA